MTFRKPRESINKKALCTPERDLKEGGKVVIALTLNGSNKRQGSHDTYAALEADVIPLQPNFVFMSGICGGNPNRVNKGDVVAITTAIEYERGTKEKHKFLLDTAKLDIDTNLERLFGLFEQEITTDLTNLAGRPESGSLPRIVLGSALSGQKVRSDFTPKTWEKMSVHVAEKKSTFSTTYSLLAINITPKLKSINNMRSINFLRFLFGYNRFEYFPSSCS